MVLCLFVLLECFLLVDLKLSTAHFENLAKAQFVVAVGPQKFGWVNGKLGDAVAQLSLILVFGHHREEGLRGVEARPGAVLDQAEVVVWSQVGVENVLQGLHSHCPTRLLQHANIDQKDEDPIAHSELVKLVPNELDQLWPVGVV